MRPLIRTAAVRSALVAAAAAAQPCDPTFTETFGSGPVGGEVFALAVFDDDGDGPRPAAIFRLGSFTSAGGLPASRLSKWDGVAWRTVESLPPGGSPDHALVVFDYDGPCPRPAVRYVAGDFL